MLRVRMMLLPRQLEAVKGRLLAHPVMLAVGAAILITAHVVFFIRLHRAAMSLAVFTGLGALVIAKHLGLLGSLYAHFRRRTRSQGAEGLAGEARKPRTHWSDGQKKLSRGASLRGQGTPADPARLRSVRARNPEKILNRRNSGKKQKQIPRRYARLWLASLLGMTGLPTSFNKP